MKTWTGWSNRLISQEEHQLYDHLLECVAQDTPEQMIARFKALFIDGMGYPVREVTQALDAIVATCQDSQDFRFILNRCCHILINRWQQLPHWQSAIPILVDLFEQEPVDRVTEFSRSRSIRRLRDQVSTFKETEQYLTLHRLATVVREKPTLDREATSKPLGTLIGRYPYLYPHCLVSEDSTWEHQENVRRIQSQMQQQFEIDLSQYVTYRVRWARLRRERSPEVASRILRPVLNPTLLSDRELVTSLRQFSGTVAQKGSYRDLARRFQAHTTDIRTYRNFKQELYHYVTSSVQPDYGQRKFNAALAQYLSRTLPERDNNLLDDFLMVRTCSQLLNFLVVDSPQSAQHFVFLDLINNLGPVLTTGILLKILLLCRKVKPYLERRLSILFNHYETTARDTVVWLVQVLEHLNIALSLNFGTVDLSHIHGLV